ncbi:DUF4251 domain-containing protein [Salegentibacter sp. F188]|uniref:DUF4251 domain-containing protein n=1 Tax=Autumnicola patrickiae TaxID=3075591 RepID=A0ABU3E2F6_9FLAO|nr:DUF4251 domain-containing protein [Salegentibacter sp. F188]MDT0690157.1 DUF4251 domain-containing protein [Salegentibacter sp. F188]
MKKIAKFRYLLLILCVTLMACGGSRNQPTDADLRGYEELKEQVNGSGFEIENQWAIPLRGGRINLIGNPNYIRFKGDNVDLFLPYFGERQSGGGYGEGGGIEYDGPTEKLEIIENQQNRNIRIQFEATAGTENLKFYINLHSNGNAETSLNSSQRDAISYRGEAKPLKEENE